MSHAPSVGGILAFIDKSDFLFKIGHSNDKKHTYKTANRLRTVEQWAAACVNTGLVFDCVLGVEMRAINPIESACLESAPVSSNANVYDLGLKQDESSRLRRIRDLEHENALLMRMLSETQIQIERLRELLSSN